MQKNYNRVYGSYMADLIINNVYRIDFVNLSASKIEKGVGGFVNVPGEAVNNLYIRNDGPCLIQYSVNGANISEMIGGVLAKTMTREFHWDLENIKSVNIMPIPTGVDTGSSVAIDVAR